MLAGKGFTISKPRAVPSRTSPPQIGQKVRLAGSLRPRELLIVLGPANCGKTRLLEELKKDRELGQAVIGEGPPPILYLNCQAVRPMPYKPVIIIDESNKLMRWSDDPGRKQLRNLLDFFVKTTKEDHLGHFMLASSESFVIDFLEKEGLHTKQYVTQEIGDLATIDEAKQFIESLMLCKKAPPTFFDTTEIGEQIDMWPRVYEICGGNIGLLERCAKHSNRLKSWEKGLKWVSRDLEGAVKRGLGPEDFPTSGSRSSAAWTEEDYKSVLREIALAKEHKHAVSFEKLRKMVGKKAVRSMVEWNLVAVRRKSEWAKDLLETVFTDLDDDKLVTMPSPAELYFVLKMYEAGKLDAAPPNDDK
ncbi:hypothetical protein KSW81_008183 [Nannochloris sp. 'desiccata']|nr:hypothetical protein KSW81_008183 [Chlorella desiccata (nom. nud.)]